jgi:hypothetical protein
MMGKDTPLENYLTNFPENQSEVTLSPGDATQSPPLHFGDGAQSASGEELAV